MDETRLKYPRLGFGLSLRGEYYDHILKNKPRIDWFEVITENFLLAGGKPIHILEQVRELYPLTFHGVSLSIGSSDPLNFDYLQKLKNLMQQFEPAWVSDHLCWTGINQTNLHDILPLPYTEEAINHVVTKIKQVQDFLGRRILIENVSSYVTYTQSQISEWEFFAAIAERADCLILLDINNVYVSSYNHHFDPEVYLNYIPKKRVQQFHIAGHDNQGDYIVDTHDHEVIPAVWALYEKAIQRFGAISTLLERDDRIPPFAELAQELEIAKTIVTKVAQTYDEIAPATA